MTIAEELAAYIRTDLAQPGTEAVTAEDDLVSRGIIDSLGIIQLTSYVEEHYGISVDPDEIVPENFHNVNALARFVEGKLRLR
jgi:acyl carrier protein